MLTELLPEERPRGEVDSVQEYSSGESGNDGVLDGHCGSFQSRVFNILEDSYAGKKKISPAPHAYSTGGQANLRRV